MPRLVQTQCWCPHQRRWTPWWTPLSGLRQVHHSVVDLSNYFQFRCPVYDGRSHRWCLLFRLWLRACLTPGIRQLRFSVEYYLLPVRPGGDSSFPDRNVHERLQEIVTVHDLKGIVNSHAKRGQSQKPRVFGTLPPGGGATLTTLTHLGGGGGIGGVLVALTP